MSWTPILKPLLLLALLYLPMISDGWGGTAVSGSGDVPPLPDRRFYIVASAEKSEVYLSERFLIKVKLYSEEALPREVQFPDISAEGFLTDPFEEPASSSEVIDGSAYNVFTFKTFARPQKTGNLKIRISLKCMVRLPTTDDIFGGHEDRLLTLTSDAIPVKAMALPEEGRPAGFYGAVGSFRLTSRYSPKKAEAGTPVTVITTVTGNGDLSLVRCPEVNDAKGFTIYRSKPVRDSKSLTCEQVFLPETAEVTSIPSADLTFFDPEKRRYITINSGPLPIDAISSPSIPQTDRTAKRESPTPLLHSPLKLQIALLGAMLSLTACIRIMKWSGGAARRRLDLFLKRKQIRKALADAGKAVDGGDHERFYTIISTFLQGELLTNREEMTVKQFDNTPPPAVIIETEMNKVESILEECDMVRYGGLRPDRNRMEATLSEIEGLLL